MKITFLGGVEEVTGSKYLVEVGDIKILVDCGLFQGPRESTKRNRDQFPIDPSSIDAVILTHAHVDHTGYIPALVKKGFRGKIYCTRATLALCGILLIDCGHIQEEDARRSEKNKGSSRSKITPLYTVKDAENSLTYFRAINYDTVVDIGASLKFYLIRAGHILGASSVILSDGKQTLTFSGDLGRPNQLIIKAPDYPKQTDFLVVESTYGDTLHEQGDPIEALGEIVNEAVAQGGKVIIPAFGVGRTQKILYCLYLLRQKKVIPEIPIFLDSPMAIKVTDLYARFPDEIKLSKDLCKAVFSIATCTPTIEDSKHINNAKGAAIIIAGSGMADGGRVLHHFMRYISDAKNTIAFVGYQAEGTHGRALTDGAKEIEIYGKPFEVNAKIKVIGSLSAHADYSEVLQWLGHLESSPKKVFLTHGELGASRAFKEKIEQKFGWTVVIPKYLESFDLE